MAIDCYGLPTNPGTSVNFPTGGIIMWGSNTLPSNEWLLCDGTSYDTGTYAALFAVIGYTFGGSGGNFNVPDMRDRIPTGRNSGTADVDTLGETGGAADVTLTAAQMPSHTHTVGTGDGGGGGGNYPPANFANPLVTINSGSAGSGSSHENRPPYLVLNFIIKI